MFEYLTINKMFMKKFLAFFAVCALFAVSCAEDEADCMKCYTEVTDTETNIKTKGASATYCDEELDKKLGAKPISLDGKVSEWVCE